MIRAALMVAMLCGCAPAPEPARMPSNAEVRRLFAAQRRSFEALRDLLLSEPAARAVGLDRIGDCRLEIGRWRWA